MKVKTRKESRVQRHKRVRAKVKGSAACPRLSMMISTRHIYVQLIDDDAGVTLVAANSLQDGNARVETAQALGKRIGEAANAKGLGRFVVDRGGYRFHGRIKAVVDGVLEAGLTNVKEAK